MECALAHSQHLVSVAGCSTLLAAMAGCSTLLADMAGGSILLARAPCNSMACAPMLRRGAMAVVGANEVREKESHAGEGSCLVEDL
jgi:hypothetical protein